MWLTYIDNNIEQALFEAQASRLSLISTDIQAAAGSDQHTTLVMQPTNSNEAFLILHEPELFTHSAMEPNPTSRPNESSSDMMINSRQSLSALTNDQRSGNVVRSKNIQELFI